MAIDADLIRRLKRSIRVKSESAEEEIEELAEACLVDLRLAGVIVTDQTEPLCSQAIKLYCKSHYGYDSDTDRFKASYESLKMAMALCGEYSGGA